MLAAGRQRQEALRQQVWVTRVAPESPLSLENRLMRVGGQGAEAPRDLPTLRSLNRRPAVSWVPLPTIRRPMSVLAPSRFQWLVSVQGPHGLSRKPAIEELGCGYWNPLV